MTVRKALPGKVKMADRRGPKTRARINWSLVDVVIDKGFEAATVQEIAARAHVGRSTFYAHFEDKDDAFLQHFIGFMRTVAASLAWGPAGCEMPVRGLFEHFGQFRPLYEQMVKAGRWGPTLKIGRVILAEGFARRLEELKVESGVPREIFAAHIAATLIGLVDWWLAHHQPCSAEEMEDYFRALATPRDLVIPAKAGTQ